LLRPLLEAWAQLVRTFLPKEFYRLSDESVGECLFSSSCHPRTPLLSGHKQARVPYVIWRSLTNFQSHCNHGPTTQTSLERRASLSAFKAHTVGGTLDPPRDERQVFFAVERVVVRRSRR
jgi:hypothetical protein